MSTIYEDIHEIIASCGMNILVAIGFIIDYLEQKKQVKMAVNNKVKNSGRPKKVKNDDFVMMKSDLELNLEKAQAWLKVKDEVIADLETKLDEAYKEQEDMLKEVDKWVFQVIHHCAEVESKTGRITLHDVDYCVDLIKRIMKHKFESKPENY
jgi:hypothetical protein